jgi:hypothetical protein
MTDSLIPAQRSFLSRVQTRNPKPIDVQPRVIESENDFPFTSFDFLRVGSGHTVCEPQHDDENRELMRRLTKFIMDR